MALIISKFRITRIIFHFSFFLFLAVSCQRRDRTTVLAEYLKEEKRVRDNESNPAALEESLSILNEKYGIDRDAEIRHVGENPGRLIELLKELKSDR